MHKSVLNEARSVMFEDIKCIFIGLKTLFSSKLDSHILEFVRKIP